jgi:hypothetical protein
VRGEPLETIVVQKANWRDIQLCKGSKQHDAWAAGVKHMGRHGKHVPDNRKVDDVNMRGVKFNRIRHGHGSYIGKNMEVYSGEWFRGKKHGPGVRYDKICDLKGEWENDVLKGPGTVTNINGDGYSGNFTVAARHKPSLLDPTQYMDGVLNGPDCEYVFPDGARYVGNFHHGKIHGFGTYASASGDVYEGQFEYGAMTGQGKLVLATKQVYEGQFKDGVPHRMCYERTKLGDEYIGGWKHGAKSGRSVHKLRNGDRYIGYYDDGMKCGHGTFLYGHVKEQYDPSTEKTILKCVAVTVAATNVAWQWRGSGVAVACDSGVRQWCGVQ